MPQLLRSLVLIWGLFLGWSTLLSAQGIIKYSYVPKKVYQNQIFPVTVIIIGTENIKNLNFAFDAKSSVQPLFNTPLVIQNGSDSFYTFYFKAGKTDIRIPELQVTENGHTKVLSSSHIPLETLKGPKDFCGVIAADIKIKNAQVSNFDESNHIVTLHIEANEANLEDMKLDWLQESGIEDIIREYAKVKGNFYAVLPISQTELKFSYFNTITNQFDIISIPIEVKDATVVTHSELNPKGDSFEQLKKFVLMSLTFFMFVMFLLKRDFFFLVIAAISLITLLTLYTPHEKVCVKQGAPVYILPTHTSTISTYIDEEFTTDILGERQPYLEIETKEGVIGWVKDEDLCKN